MEALTLPSPTKGWKADTGFLGRWILLGAGAGAISRALIGGVGVVMAARWTSLRAGADRWWGQDAALTAYAAIATPPSSSSVPAPYCAT